MPPEGVEGDGGARRVGRGRDRCDRATLARASSRRSSTVAASASVIINGGSMRTHGVVPPAQLDQQATVEAGPADAQGQRGVGRPGAAGVRGGVGLHELDTQHQATTPHLADRAVARRQLLEAGHEARPRLGGPRHQPLRAQHRGSVAVPATMASWLPRNVPMWAPGAQVSSSER